MNLTTLKAAVSASTFDSSVDPTDWINAKYTEICDLEDWSFMRAVSAVTVTSGSPAVTSIPTDFGVANALHDQYGCSLEKLNDPEDFVSRYMNSVSPFTGQPEAFCVFGSPGTFDGGLFGDGDFDNGEGQIAVGPTPNITSTAFRLIYERTVSPLVNGTDEPIIPTGHHMAIVFGARAMGCRLYGMVAEAEEADAEFRGAMDVMRRKYLRPLRDRRPQGPAYRP